MELKKGLLFLNTNKYLTYVFNYCPKGGFQVINYNGSVYWLRHNSDTSKFELPRDNRITTIEDFIQYYPKFLLDKNTVTGNGEYRREILRSITEELNNTKNQKLLLIT